jgi:hypothetical protein
MFVSAKKRAEANSVIDANTLNCDIQRIIR